MENNLQSDHKPAMIPSMLKTQCPRCRRGKMFVDPNPYHLKSMLKMHDECSVCGQQYDIEVGFYYGTSYVSYALTVALSVATLIAWWVFFGLSLEDNSLLYWIIVNGILLVLLQPVFMRWARTMWLSFFVSYDPDWQHQKAEAPERVNENMKNAW